MSWFRRHKQTQEAGVTIGDLREDAALRKQWIRRTLQDLADVWLSVGDDFKPRFNTEERNLAITAIQTLQELAKKQDAP